MTFADWKRAWVLAPLWLCSVILRAPAEELAIPPGYFATSGGFYLQENAAGPCWFYAPASGCTIDLCYPRASLQATPGADAAGATASWYAGEAVSYRDGMRPGPVCSPPLNPAPSASGPEVVAPGPLLPGSDSR